MEEGCEPEKSRSLSECVLACPSSATEITSLSSLLLGQEGPLQGKCNAIWRLQGFQDGTLSRPVLDVPTRGQQGPSLTVPPSATSGAVMRERS